MHLLKSFFPIERPTNVLTRGKGTVSQKRHTAAARVVKVHQTKPEEKIPLWNTMFCTIAKAQGSSQSWPTTVKHGLCHPVRQCQWTFYPFQPNTPPIKWIVTSLHAITSIARKTLIPCYTYLCKKFIIYDDLFSWCIYVESVEVSSARSWRLPTAKAEFQLQGELPEQTPKPRW